MRDRTTMNGSLIEDLDRLALAPAAGFAPWEYVSRAPYRVQIVSCDFPLDQHTSEVWPSVIPAMIRFAELALPMRRSFWASVIDESFRVVFAYSTDPVARMGPWEMLWYGTEETFGIMEDLELVDPMDLAMWEAIARAEE